MGQRKQPGAQHWKQSNDRKRLFVSGLHQYQKQQPMKGWTMSRSVMDLKEVCLELCAGGILIKAMELVKLPNYQSLDPVEFLYECLVSEAARRQTRKVATRIKKSACFYPDACIENTLYAPDRNLNRGLIERLAACVFVALTDGRQCFPAANTVAPQVKLVPVSTFIYIGPT